MIMSVIASLVVQYCASVYHPKVCFKTITVCIFMKAKKYSKTQTELSEEDVKDFSTCMTDYKNI